MVYRKSEPADIVKKLIASSLDFKEASKWRLPQAFFELPGLAIPQVFAQDQVVSALFDRVPALSLFRNLTLSALLRLGNPSAIFAGN
jgi:hypothetical protein